MTFALAPMGPSLVQINISPGGMPKRPIASARVTAAGVEGDRQIHLQVHGGPDRAVCLYSEELYQQFGEAGIPIRAGDIGENFTTCGLDLLALSPGDRLAVGACQIQLTRIRVPCKQLNQWHPDLFEQIQGRSGWLARVLVEGVVRPGDAITLLSPRA